MSRAEIAASLPLRRQAVGRAYKASLIDSEAYLLTCMGYIEINPLRACMVKHSGDYGWSSYGINAHGKSDPLVTPNSLYPGLDNSVENRRRAYR